MMSKQTIQKQIEETEERPFNFEGRRAESIMSLICSFKFPKNYKEREKALYLSEEEALKLVEKANGIVKWKGKSYPLGSVVFYGDDVIPTESKKYSKLMLRIYSASEYASI